MSPVGAVVTESIGSGENGLRVEVSLKYRRLLVQKLHKESLLSAKDHENFRLVRFDRALTDLYIPPRSVTCRTPY